MLKTIVLLVIEHVRQRPIRVSLAVLGVAIGVSAWLAIRLANVEVFRAFEESVDAVVGKASIQVTGKKVDLDEQILLSIRQHPSVVAANPVLRIVGTSRNGSSQGKGVMIFGLDLLEYTNESLPMFSGIEKPARSSMPFLTKPPCLSEALSPLIGILPLGTRWMFR